MELITDLVKVILPAGLVLYAMYLTIRTLLDRQLAEKQLDIQAEYAKILLPTRLQAYERMCLFLERITPNNLLVRLSGTATNALEFQQILLHEIREEFNHNLSQQVYLSDTAWQHIKQAQHEVAAIINAAAKDVQPEASPLELSRRVFDLILTQQLDPTAKALGVVKDEVRQQFMR
jgi:hypothetical protein